MRYGVDRGDGAVLRAALMVCRGLFLSGEFAHLSSRCATATKRSLTIQTSAATVIAQSDTSQGKNVVKVCRLVQAMLAGIVSSACLVRPIHGAHAAMNHRALAAMKRGAPVRSARSAVARGKYLVTFGSCTDCHTPGSFFGKPDMKRFLGGSDVGFAIPGLGVFVGPNLTPDNKTGLGSWTEEQIVTALTTGRTPTGRILAPVMPWHAYANLTKSDAVAIADYLKSLPAVSRQVGGPYGQSQTPAESVMVVLPPAVYTGLPKAAAPAATASPSGAGGTGIGASKNTSEDRIPHN